jgi:hypothetical protein
MGCSDKLKPNLLRSGLNRPNDKKNKGHLFCVCRLPILLLYVAKMRIHNAKTCTKTRIHNYPKVDDVD